MDNKFSYLSADFHFAIALQDGGDGDSVLNMEDQKEVARAVMKPR